MPPEHRLAALQLVRKLVKTERGKRELLPDADVSLNGRELPEVLRPFAVELSGVHIASQVPTYVNRANICWCREVRADAKLVARHRISTPAVKAVSFGASASMRSFAALVQSPPCEPFSTLSCYKGAMAAYRVEYVDHGENVYAVEHVEHDDEGALIEKLRVRNSHGIGAGYNIWDGDRLVHRHRK